MPTEVRVPFLDVGAGYRELAAELDAAYRRVMASGCYLLGPELEAFEAAFAQAVGARYAVGVGSGLDALVLALRALAIGPGDEVIVPSNTYIATWLAVSAVGARPVPVDPHPVTCNLEVAAVAAAIGPRTRALLPVHLYGRPVAAAGFAELAARTGLALLFDAAQAHGATSSDRPVGAFGDASAWSFYPGKNLSGFADGGAVTTSDPALARRIRCLRNYGAEHKHVHLERGLNSRLDELQAAFLRVKLERLAAWNRRRAARADRYLEALAGLDLGLPAAPPEQQSAAWHLFVVRSARRDWLRGELAGLGIESLVHYPRPPFQQPAYRDLGLLPGAFPVAERLAAEVLSLPCGPHLSNDAQQAVIEALGCLLNGNPAGGVQPEPPAR